MAAMAFLFADLKMVYHSIEPTHFPLGSAYVSLFFGNLFEKVKKCLVH